MKKRIFLDQNELRKVYLELKVKGLSAYQIAKDIGANFRSALYGGRSLPENSVAKLEAMINRKIKRRTKKEIKLELIKNIQLAEIVGILLGDGCISIYQNTKGTRWHKVMVSLNKSNQTYIDHVKKLMKEVLGKECAVYPRKDSNSVELVIYSKLILQALLAIGMKHGNKVQNQVGVPKWIKNIKEFTIACLRGLIDTDGSIYIAKRDKQLMINFKNHSRPLLEDFKEMCDLLSIKTSKLRTYDVEICSKNAVKTFLNQVYPIKWKIMLSKNPSIEQNLEYKRK